MRFNKIDDVLKKDKLLAKVINKLDFPIVFFKEDLFYALISSIISQQLSLKAAETIFNRFLRLFDDLYPDANALLSMTDEVMRSVGLSRQKVSYIKNVAEYHVENNLHSSKWVQYSDEEIISKLTSIKGVGVWTVQMILMFYLGRADVFPVGDLGVRQSMMKLYNIESEGKEQIKDLERIAENWRPYRSYASFYLWNWKDVK